MLPYVILHNAVSADGRTLGFAADIALYYDLAARFEADCVLAGSGTILAAAAMFPEEMAALEDAPLPEKVPGDPRPLLAVPDSRGRIRTWHLWQRAPYWRDIVVLCSRSTPQEYLAYLRRRGIDAIVAGEDRVDMRAALGDLNARYGVERIRLDSGGTLNGVLLREGLVDEASVLVHPALVGGTSPASIFRAPDLAPSGGAIPLRLVHLERFAGDIVWLRYEVVRERAE
ncbi:MAG: RibD family protein [Methanomicrobiales archaeon]|nr:RibD family protein [Methanomicrobiales archaeon]MDI6875698.1 RibD family protein [Methanomicrobiales archaeon]